MYRHIYIVYIYVQTYIYFIYKILYIYAQTYIYKIFEKYSLYQSKMQYMRESFNLFFSHLMLSFLSNQPKLILT